MSGGAWPFQVREVIRLVNSVNGQDLCLQIDPCVASRRTCMVILTGRTALSSRKRQSITGL
jgi:hypothetical protein